MDVLDELQQICERLRADCSARAVALVDMDGEAVASAGSIAHLDVNALARDVDAGLLVDREYCGEFHVADRSKIHISLIAERLILAVIFDQASSLGLVRLRVKKATEDLLRALNRGPGPGETGGSSAHAKICHR